MALSCCTHSIIINHQSSFDLHKIFYRVVSGSYTGTNWVWRGRCRDTGVSCWDWRRGCEGLFSTVCCPSIISIILMMCISAVQDNSQPAYAGRAVMIMSRSRVRGCTVFVVYDADSPDLVFAGLSSAAQWWQYEGSNPGQWWPPVALSPLGSGQTEALLMSPNRKGWDAGVMRSQWGFWATSKEEQTIVSVSVYTYNIVQHFCCGGQGMCLCSRLMCGDLY